MAERSIFSVSSRGATSKSTKTSGATGGVNGGVFRTPSSSIGHHLGLPSTSGPIAKRNKDGSVTLRPNTDAPPSPFDVVSFAEVRERAERARRKFASKSTSEDTPLFSETSRTRVAAGELFRSIFDTPRSLFGQRNGDDVAEFGRKIIAGLESRDLDLDLFRSASVSTSRRTTPQSARAASGRRCQTGSDEEVFHSEPSYHEVMRRKSRDRPPSLRNSGRLGNTPVIKEFRFPETNSRAHSQECDSAARVASRMVVAVVEGRGEARGEVGIAGIGLGRPILTLCQVSDDKTYSKLTTVLTLLNPAEVLIAASIVNRADQGFKVVEAIGKELPEVTFTSVPRAMFDAGRGKMELRRICIPECLPVFTTHEEKYYCVAAGAAVVAYAEVKLSAHFDAHSVKIVYHAFGKNVMIDSRTARNLEILGPCGSSRKEDGSMLSSLLGVLQHTKTKCGARLLRASLLQPPFDLAVTEQRLDCVDELSRNRDFYGGLQAVLGRWVEVDQVTSVCSMRDKRQDAKARIQDVESMINVVIRLKQILAIIPPLLQELNAGQNQLFLDLAEKLRDPRFAELQSHLEQVIRDDVGVQPGSVAALNQRIYAVKPKINGYLDVSVSTYKEVIQEMERYVHELADKEDLRMELSNNASKGFHIRVLGRKRGPANDGGNAGRNDFISRESLPKYFLRVSKSGSHWTCTTPELVFFGEKAKNAIHCAQTITGDIVKEVLKNIRKKVSCLYEISDVVATLDLLASLAHYRIFTKESSRPRFSKLVTEVVAGRHPILDKLKPESVVTNDFCFYEGKNFMILTGPNMSGKTTFLRELALLQIMAQLGSFVPAQLAVFRPADIILSRMGLSDSMENEASTAKAELVDFQYILQSRTKNCLILIDELGRSTSPTEGPNLCWALLEPLVQSKAFVAFATHCHFLTSLSDMYFNVFLKQFEAEVEDDADGGPIRTKLKLTHRLLDGVTRVEHYGLLAAAAVLPADIVADAIAMAQRLEAARTLERSRHPESLARRKARLNHDFAYGVTKVLATAVAFGLSDEDTAAKSEELEHKWIVGLDLLKKEEAERKDVVVEAQETSASPVDDEAEFEELRRRLVLEENERKKQTEEFEDGWDDEGEEEETGSDALGNDDSESSRC